MMTSQLSVDCVARDTRILMANGLERLVQYVKRGDMIAGDIDHSKKYRVARVIHNRLSGMTPISMIKINADALGYYQPSIETIISSNHPIFYNDSRYTAKAFRKNKEIKYFSKSKTLARDILPVNNDDSYSLYNIQFEVDGYFVANGLVVDSLSPFSTILPLPRELYFDDGLYENPIKNTKPILKKKL